MKDYKPPPHPRHCADCGIVVPPGYVRCQSCYRTATIVPQDRYGEAPKKEETTDGSPLASPSPGGTV